MWMHENVQSSGFFSHLGQHVFVCGTECDSLGPRWPCPGLFSCCWLNVPVSINMDKRALQDFRPLRSSPMPQTNEFLKTASIKPQARSIGHRVDFISAARRGFGTHHFHPGIVSSRSLQPRFTLGWNRGSRPRTEQHNEGSDNLIREYLWWQHVLWTYTRLLSTSEGLFIRASPRTSWTITHLNPFTKHRGHCGRESSSETRLSRHVHQCLYSWDRFWQV